MLINWGAPGGLIWSGVRFPKATMVASSVLANDGFEKRTPDLCHKTSMLNLSPLHPQNAIDFNPLTHHTLAGAEPEKDELKKKKERRAQWFSNFITVQCFQPNKVYFRFQTFKYTSIK